MKRILIEISEGHIVRNLLENNLLDFLTKDGSYVDLITPARRVEYFVDRYENPLVKIHDLNLLNSNALSRSENLEIFLGRLLRGKKFSGLRRFMWKFWGEYMASRQSDLGAQFIASTKPNVVVSTHLTQFYGRGLVAVAHQRDIPTLGNLNSWDNVWKGLRVRPDIVTCWSENNKNEICFLEAYQPNCVEVIGAPAFDAYFASDAIWSRSELCAHLGLNPLNPIVLYATLGQFKQQIDETNPLEVLLKAVDAGEIPKNAQIVVRLHPWSRETYFKPLLAHPAVIVSRYENYVPGLGWTPTRAEAILAGNLMRHADVVISPGSTMSIEPSIFDTPTIVPVFNEYMPEVYEKYFRETWFNQHFGPILHKNWLPIVRSAPEMKIAINHALADRTWYREGRASIRQEILGPLDGKATERLANSILRTASADV